MPNINTPSQIITALRGGSPVVLSISGGKDSEAMTKAVLDYLAANGLKNKVYFIHADLGRMEWLETPSYMRTMEQRYNVPLAVSSRDHDLLEGIQRRAGKLEGQNKPPFPSAAARYCTAGWKRNVINTWLRHEFPADVTVVQCIGLRRDESRGRAKTPDTCANDMASAPTLGRTVLNWYPVAAWSTADVWESLGVSMSQLAEVQTAVKAGATPAEAGWRFHPAYAYGNERLSCSLCVLAGAGDIANGARHNPDLYRELVKLEQSSGFSFQQNKPLSLVAPELLTPQ